MSYEIGLTESETLGNALRSAGFKVITGGSFIESGRVIRSSGGTFPIVVVEREIAGIRTWVSKNAMDRKVVVLRDPQGKQVITAESATYVTLPTTLQEILSAAGLPTDPSNPRQNVLVNQDASVGTKPQGTPAVTEDVREEPTGRIAPTPETKRTRTPRANQEDPFWFLDANPATEEEELVASDDSSDPQGSPPPALEPTVPADPNLPDWMTEAVTSEPEPVEPAYESTPETADPNLPDWMTEAVTSEPEPVEPAYESTPEPAPVYEDIEEDSFVPLESFPAEAMDYDFDDEDEDDVVAPPMDINAPDPTPVVQLPTQENYRPLTSHNVIPEPEPVRAPVRQSSYEPSTRRAPEPQQVQTREPTETFEERIDRLSRGETSIAPESRGSHDLTPIVLSQRSERPTPSPASNRKLSPVIFSQASKGGVGKSSMTVSLSQMASTTPDAENRRLRVTMVDANRGQGGLRVFLRVPDTAPSIYDLAVGLPVERAIIYPKMMNSMRPQRLGDINYAVILAPPDSVSDARLVSAHVYAKAIEYARMNSDLVIVDTQISETFDTTGIIENVAIPNVRGEGGFSMLLSDTSTEGLDNMLNRMQVFRKLDIPRSHILSVVNLVTDYTPRFVEKLKSNYSQYSEFMGLIALDPNFKDLHDVGNGDVTGTELEDMVRAILYRVTGDERFAPRVAEKKKSRLRLFGRKRG